MAEPVASLTTTPSPWGAIEAFRRLLKEGWGDAFKGLVVFGSLARGEWTPDSDVDVIVLLDNSCDQKQEGRKVWQKAFELYEQYDVEVQPIVLTERQYQTGSSPLYFNVRREGWFVMAEERSEDVAKLMEQARQALSDARYLLEDERYDSATSRAYYAMFNAAQAALLSLGITRSRHSGVVAAFGYHFANTGKVSMELHQAFANAFEPRINADYGADTVDPQLAHDLVSTAATFIDSVNQALGRRG